MSAPVPVPTDWLGFKFSVIVPQDGISDPEFSASRQPQDEWQMAVSGLPTSY